MEDYRRQIAYLYHYDSKIESKSLGFVKIEVRNHRCRLEVHLKEKRAKKEEKRNIYLYFSCHQRTIGICLGELLEKDGILFWQGNIDTCNIQGTGVRLEDTKGIWVRCGEDSDYVAAWEDAIEHIGKLMLYPKGGERCIRCPWLENCERSTKDATDRGRGVYEGSHPTGKKSMEASRSAYRVCHCKRRQDSGKRL